MDSIVLLVGIFFIIPLFSLVHWVLFETIIDLAIIYLNYLVVQGSLQAHLFDDLLQVLPIVEALNFLLRRGVVLLLLSLLQLALWEYLVNGQFEHVLYHSGQEHLEQLA